MFRFFLLTSLFMLQTNFIKPSDTNNQAPASKVPDLDSDNVMPLTVTQEQLQAALATRQARINAAKESRAATIITRLGHRFSLRKQLETRKAIEKFNKRREEENFLEVLYDSATTPDNESAVAAPASKVPEDNDPTVFMRYLQLIGPRQAHLMNCLPKLPSRDATEYKLPENTDPKISTILLQPMPTSPAEEVLATADSGSAHSSCPISSTMVAATITSTRRKQEKYK